MGPLGAYENLMFLLCFEDLEVLEMALEDLGGSPLGAHENIDKNFVFCCVLSIWMFLGQHWGSFWDLGGCFGAPWWALGGPWEVPEGSLGILGGSLRNPWGPIRGNADKKHGF